MTWCNKYLNKFTRMIIPGVLFLGALACKNDPDQIRALTGRGVVQEDRATEVTVIYSQDGNVKMRLFAHSFVRNTAAKRPYIDMNRGLKMEFYNDSGVVEDVLTADSSRYYETQRDFIVWDSVKLVTKKGEMLTTEEMIWNEQIQKFFTEKPVVIHTNSEVLYGNGMEANRDFSWYRIIHPTGTVQVNKGELPQ